MTGHLHLVFAEGGGKTVLREQSFRAPMHLSKPYWDGNHLIVNAVNPTAGLFSGDVVDVSVRAEAGSRGVLTSPSASRVYQARPDSPATILKQTITVESGAWLDVIPEMLIPQAGSRFAQETFIDMHEGGRLFFLDRMAPGRVASGEVFAFEELHWTTRLHSAGRLVAMERFRLSPGGSLHSLRLHFPATYHATGYLVALQAGRDLPRAIGGLSASDVFAGASLLAPGVVCFKMLAETSPALRRTIARLRGLVYDVLGMPAPLLRKL
jgi:urease accessory protein